MSNIVNSIARSKSSVKEKAFFSLNDYYDYTFNYRTTQ